MLVRLSFTSHTLPTINPWKICWSCILRLHLWSCSSTISITARICSSYIIIRGYVLTSTHITSLRIIHTWRGSLSTVHKWIVVGTSHCCCTVHSWIQIITASVTSWVIICVKFCCLSRTWGSKWILLTRRQRLITKPTTQVCWSSLGLSKCGITMKIIKTSISDICSEMEVILILIVEHNSISSIYKLSSSRGRIRSWLGFVYRR